MTRESVSHSRYFNFFGVVIFANLQSKYSISSSRFRSSGFCIISFPSMFDKYFFNKILNSFL